MLLRNDVADTCDYNRLCGGTRRIILRRAYFHATGQLIHLSIAVYGRDDYKQSAGDHAKFAESYGLM